MSSIGVVRKEFSDSIRSRQLVWLTGLFLLFALGVTYLYASDPSLVGTAGKASFTGLLNLMTIITSLMVPLLGFVLGYNSIVSERERGSLKYLLSLPYTRWNVVIGKAIGLSGVVVVAMLVGLSVSGAAGMVFYDSFSIVEYGSFVLVTLLLAVSSTAIGVGISATVQSSARALYAIVGVFSLIIFLWSYIPRFVRFLVNGLQTPSGPVPVWVDVFSLMNPSTAYSHALAMTVSPLSDLGTTSGAPLYLQNWVGFVVLGLWIVGPLAIGYLRFEHTDL